MSAVRYDYIDIAKGLGILMVVWAHIMITGWTHQFIYAFHMPLFFFLSGMLFQKEKYLSFGSFVVRRSKRLLVPYVVYSVLTWAFWAVFRYLRHDEVDSYLMPLLQTFYAQGSGAFMVHNSALWFVPCLFLVEILYFFFCRLGQWWCVAVCFAAAFLSFMLGTAFDDNWWLTPPCNADAALIALPFYCIGNMLNTGIGHSKMVTSVKENKGTWLLVCAVMTIPLFWSATSFGECSMGSSSYQCPGWVFLLRALLGCGWLVCLSLLISVTPRCSRMVAAPMNYTKWAGVNSLDIMCLHIPVKGVCMIGVAMVLYMSVDDVGSHELYSALAFVLTMLVVWLIIKFFPVSMMTQKLSF